MAAANRNLAVLNNAIRLNLNPGADGVAIVAFLRQPDRQKWTNI